MALEDHVELNIDDALAGIATIESALTSAVQSFKVELADALNLLQDPTSIGVDASGITTAIDEAVAAADTEATVTADSTDVTSSVDSAIQAADSEAVITADATDVTSAIDDAVAAADTEVPVTVDPAAAESSLSGFSDRASNAITQIFGSENIVAKGLETIEKVAPGAGEAITGAMGPAGVVLAAAGAAAFVVGEGIHHFVQLTDQVRNFSLVTGASAQTSSRMVVALEELGASPDRVSNALFRMGRQIDDGSSKLESLGVQIARTKDGSPDLVQTFLNVADAVKQSGGGAHASEIAFAAFGRQGVALLPILTRGSEALKEFGKLADERHEVFSQHDLDQARDFSISMRSFHDSVNAAEIAIARGLVPALTHLAEEGARIVTSITNIGFSVDHLLKPVGGLGGVIKEVINPTEGLSRATDALLGKQTLQGRITGDLLNPVRGLGDLIGIAGGKHEDAASKIQQVAAAEELEKGKIESANQALQDQAKALDALVAAQTRLIDSQLGVIGAQDSLTSSQDTLRKAQEDYTKAVREHGPASAEAVAAHQALEQAGHGLLRSYVDLAKAQAQQTIDQREANGETLSAQDKQDVLRDALDKVAGTVGGPLHDALLGLAGDLKTAEQNSDISINFGTEGLEATIGGVHQLLTDLNQLPHTEQIKFANNLPGVGGAPRMAGGPVGPGDWIVAESSTGAEHMHLNPGSSGFITNAQDTRRLLADGRPIEVTVNEVAGDPRATAFEVAAIFNSEATR